MFSVTDCLMWFVRINVFVSESDLGNSFVHETPVSPALCCGFGERFWLLSYDNYQNGRNNREFISPMENRIGTFSWASSRHIFMYVGQSARGKEEKFIQIGLAKILRKSYRFERDIFPNQIIKPSSENAKCVTHHRRAHERIDWKTCTRKSLIESHHN